MTSAEKFPYFSVAAHIFHDGLCVKVRVLLYQVVQRYNDGLLQSRVRPLCWSRGWSDGCEEYNPIRDLHVCSNNNCNHDLSLTSMKAWFLRCLASPEFWPTKLNGHTCERRRIFLHQSRSYGCFLSRVCLIKQKLMALANRQRRKNEAHPN